ncbi:hypothetical protein EYZ11_010984 [Aspergillus tanneri]|uniref:Uncharacterized protein n=1 Tax=Aspergillus tanneri TaxID=1220188 RepID=A0A4S3J4B2_9EURO|nr:hypothetical protein EYZ11_010984 [Aspergillus tanneri]
MKTDGEKMDGARVPFKRSNHSRLVADFEGHESTGDGLEYNRSDKSEEEEWWREDESEDSDREQDIEEHEYTTPGDAERTVKIWLFLSNDGMSQSRWMKNFVAECTCDGVVVATALARYIHREGMRNEFWEKMEEPSEETCDVAFHVFDRYGTVSSGGKAMRRPEVAG